MAMTGAERISAYRERQRENGEADTSRTYKVEHKREYKSRYKGTDKSFTGCDGEGCGTDDKGRQNYALFRMGERELFRNGERLTTSQLLHFITEHPRDEILVGFAFGYDVTMILRDLSPQQRLRLFNKIDFAEGKSRYVWYKDYDIEYLPKNYLRVARVTVTRDASGKEKRTRIKGSTRTIYETFGFYQKSFIKVLTEFNTGTKEERERIALNKSRRSEFTEIGEEERGYCELECRLLAELMEQLRNYCHATGIVPRTWNGAGKLASALHALHKTPTNREVRSCIPDSVFDYGNMAYYGGRFEITRTGLLNQKVYEYDIRSAYPDAMRQLPCLDHGRWERVSDPKALRVHRGLYIATCKFKAKCGSNRGAGQLGGLPIRSKEGHLYWPLEGSGVYWNVEIESARKLGFNVRLLDGWTYTRNCDCCPFDWLEPLFEYRKSIGSSGPGYPIKLAINSLYGKLVQRIGNGKYANLIWGSLITAITRARLNDAIAQAPTQIVMVATDAVYSLVPLNLEEGDRLGQWEKQELVSLFIVQPGLYWSPDLRKKKSRGLSSKFFETRNLTQRFESGWKRWLEFQNSKLEREFPSIAVPVPGFIGLKLASSRNKPDLAGTWVNEKRIISFDYRNKRQGHRKQGDHIVTCIKHGFPGLVSLPHKDFLKSGGAEPWESARLMLEEQPDYVDLGIPFKD